MKITVTKEDIANGRKRDPNNCAVALALRKAGVTHFGVTGMLVCIAPGPTSVMLPGPVQEWIMDFDRGTPVAPIEFDLTLPEPEPETAGRPHGNEEGPKQTVEPAASKPEPEPKKRKSCRPRIQVPISAFVRQFVSTVPILTSQAGDRGSRRKSANLAGRRPARKVLTVE